VQHLCRAAAAAARTGRGGQLGVLLSARGPPGGGLLLGDGGELGGQGHGCGYEEGCSGGEVREGGRERAVTQHRFSTAFYTNIRHTNCTRHALDTVSSTLIPFHRCLSCSHSPCVVDVIEQTSSISIYRALLKPYQKVVFFERPELHFLPLSNVPGVESDARSFCLAALRPAAVAVPRPRRAQYAPASRAWRRPAPQAGPAYRRPCARACLCRPAVGAAGAASVAAKAKVRSVQCCAAVARGQCMLHN